MAKVSMTTKVDVPASQLWDLIGGFNALPAWHPAIEKSEVEEDDSGSIRTLTLAGGGKIVERLESQDDRGHSYSYAIL